MHARIFIISFLLTFTLQAQAAESNIHVVTEEAFPLQYSQNGEISGPTTALVKAILNHAHLNYDLTILPWARAYQAALTSPNTLIYSIARTEDREDKFQWIGSVFELEYQLMGLASLPLTQPVTLDSLKDLRIGVIRNSATYQYLTQQNFTNLHVLDRPEQVIRMVISKRIDLFPIDSSVFKAVCRRLLIDCQGISAKFKLAQPSTSLYLALSNSSDRQLVEKLRTSYQYIMAK
ncbi:substrate-binding periplasmic protein [Thalassotalea sp. PLHSN55]|uniref:substrate-binding periplasmic protein n=1 Tax=Thalassotalea sp. PLHSN55 TaxID=3435888 RepID=UPI003F87C36F